LEKQIALGKIYSTIGDLALSFGEAAHLGQESKDYQPGFRPELYAKGEGNNIKEGQFSRPPGVWQDGIPPGGIYNPPEEDHDSREGTGEHTVEHVGEQGFPDHHAPEGIEGPMATDPGLGTDHTHTGDLGVFDGPMAIDPGSGTDYTHAGDPGVSDGPMAIDPGLGTDHTHAGDPGVSDGPMSIDPSQGTDHPHVGDTGAADGSMSIDSSQSGGDGGDAGGGVAASGGGGGF
jgi:hypothetical protein